MKKIFSYNSYKNYLKDIVESQGRGSIAKLAEAAGCDRTYLSQCLSTKVQLTPDHIFGISQYLKLAEDEEDYFLLMLLYDRSASRGAQGKVKEKMEKMVQSNLILSKKISQKADSNQLTAEQKTKYYLSWKYAAIHTLTSIKEFQSISSISKKTRIPEPEVAFVLQDLLEMGLIRQNNGKWVHSGKNIHIPIGSPLTTQNHLNWRLRSVENVNNKNAIHYTTLFSIAKKDWEQLRDDLLTFIEKQRDFIHASGTEEMFCFCCDLYQPLD